MPLSSLSQYRRYETAARRVIAIRRALPKASLAHGMGVGSRTLMAVLSYFGVDYFDSTSWFTQATRGEKLLPITLCIFDKPKGKPECELCQLHVGTGNVPGAGRACS